MILGELTDEAEFGSGNACAWFPLK